MEQFKLLIEEAYTLFSSYSIDNELAVCTYCCVSTEDALLLKTLTPKNMPATLIFEYLDAATSASSEDDPLIISQMKCLLPRILELLVEGAYLRHSDEIILDKCRCHQTAYWQPAELYFLMRFARAYFTYTLTAEEYIASADEVIIMFDLAELDIQPLLETWLNLTHQPNALYALVQFINRGYNNAFANPSLITQLDQWLTQPEVVAQINNALLASIAAAPASLDVSWEYDMAFDTLNQTQFS